MLKYSFGDHSLLKPQDTTAVEIPGDNYARTGRGKRTTSENDVASLSVDDLCRRLRTARIPHVHFHCSNATNIRDFQRNNRNVDARRPFRSVTARILLPKRILFISGIRASDNSH